MKRLILLLGVLSAVGCVKSYEDYYTRAFVLKYEYDIRRPVAG